MCAQPEVHPLGCCWRWVPRLGAPKVRTHPAVLKLNSRKHWLQAEQVLLVGVPQVLSCHLVFGSWFVGRLSDIADFSDEQGSFFHFVVQFFNWK